MENSSQQNILLPNEELSSSCNNQFLHICPSFFMAFVDSELILHKNFLISPWNVCLLYQQ